MGAQSSLLGLVGATGLAVSKIAETGAQLAEEKKEKNKALEENKVDEDKEALKKADVMLKKADVEEKLGKLQDEYKTSKDELKQWKKGMVDVGNGTYMKTNDDLTKDIKLRSKSLKIMAEKITAMKLQRDTYRRIIGGNK